MLHNCEHVVAAVAILVDALTARPAHHAGGRIKRRSKHEYRSSNGGIGGLWATLTGHKMLNHQTIE